MVRWEESQKNQPVVQRNEVEVGDLDRRPQLQDKPRETRDASSDMTGETGNQIQGTHKVVWDESVAVVLREETRGKEDVNNFFYLV